MTDSDQRTGLSGAARAAIAVVAALVLVVAFAVLRGGSGDAGGGGASTAPAGSASSTPTRSTPESSPRKRASRPGAPAVVTIRVRGGQPVGRVRRIEVRKGDRIRFRVVSDAPDEVHFHGYDVEREVGPAAPARFDVKADIEGRFEVELHHAEAKIGEIDVRPS
jgi:FtsP/CotA-like multicopper oxidase with cupredoxin domain